MVPVVDNSPAHSLAADILLGDHNILLVAADTSVVRAHSILLVLVLDSRFESRDFEEVHRMGLPWFGKAMRCSILTEVVVCVRALGS